MPLAVVYLRSRASQRDQNFLNLFISNGGLILIGVGHDHRYDHRRHLRYQRWFLRCHGLHDVAWMMERAQIRRGSTSSDHW